MFFHGIFIRGRSLRRNGGFASCASALGTAALMLSINVQAQTPALRCDLQVKSTPGIGAEAACLDLVAMKNGGPAIQTSGNATRISTDGFRLCRNAFTISTPAEADVVFIYDNSGSMWSHFAVVNPATNDTNFYHNSGCGSGGGGGVAVTDSVTYNTVTGPRTVAVPANPANCRAEHLAGDPYNARAQVVQRAVDYLALTSPNSTAGAMSFARDPDHQRPPLPLSVPANRDLVKASVAMDSIGATYYGPPLRLANTWLNDTALTNTAKKAIVFISDGAPNAADRDYLNAVSIAIPIYSIFLGDSTAQYQRLQEMSTRSGGAFHLVPPQDIARLNQVMQAIIQAITVTTLPTSIEITNAAWAPPMVSRATNMTRGADSSISVVLDSIIALKAGVNNLNVKVTMPGNLVTEYPVAVKADGPLAGATTSELVCHQQPTLVLLNEAGQVDTAYPADLTRYDIRLTRTTSDIGQAVVTANSTDSAKAPNSGDLETIVLTGTTSSGGTTTNRREDYGFNGSMRVPVDGNGTLEAPPNGFINLTWSHPRDPRETASFSLPGRRIPTTPGFIDIVRVVDVPGGSAIATPVADPIIIRGGVTVTKTGATGSLTAGGNLHNPSVSETLLDPNKTPTWVFKTASPFKYEVSIFDHLGQFLYTRRGQVDSLKWEQMRGNNDSMAVAMSILPVTDKGQPFGTGVYIMQASITTLDVIRQDLGKPARVLPVTRAIINRFGYRR